jgi:uncharacterized protein YndB with AHSA1/START domain
LKPVHDWVAKFEQLWSTQLDRIKVRAERNASGRAKSQQHQFEKTERLGILMNANHGQTVETLEIRKEVTIKAPIKTAFQALLDELGPQSQMLDGKPMPLTLEAWPGGRWFRDLGDNSGHLWGHVQVIKAPTLLELWGPMAMSYPAINHIQYRLKAEGSGTVLTLLHRAVGLISLDHREGMPKGWGFKMERVRQLAERK